MAKIRVSPDRDLVEIILPTGESFLYPTEDDAGEVTEVPEDDWELLEGSDGCYLAAVGEAGLKPNTIYKLVEVPTEFEPDAEIDIEEA